MVSNNSEINTTEEQRVEEKITKKIVAKTSRTGIARRFEEGYQRHKCGMVRNSKQKDKA